MLLFKRFLIAASALLLSVGIFTSCSDNGDGNGGSGEVQFIGCFSVFTKLVLAECVVDDETIDNCGEPTDASYENCIRTDVVGAWIDCAVAEDIDDDICGEATLNDCKEHYTEEYLAGNCTPGLSGSSDGGT